MSWPRSRWKPGELDLLDGSPPCASFSTAGKREAGWGKVKAYSDTKQRTDDLFFEYARLLAGIRPRVFVAENVSGLVKGTAKGYFKLVLSALRDCGYRVEAKVLDASWLGVPQARQRLIFIGVRDDLGVGPRSRSRCRTSTRCGMRCRGSSPVNGGWQAHAGSRYPSPTIGADLGAATATSAEQGSAVTDPETGQDITIEPYAIGRECVTRLRPGMTRRLKYPSLIRPDSWRLPRLSPATGQSGGLHPAAGSPHWSECRKLTLGEFRRLAGFPDDFALTGTYEQRWERIGRAVPPVMMAASLPPSVTTSWPRSASPPRVPDIAEQFTTGGWQFTPEVAGVFPEHVRASVPFYDAIQDLIAETTDWLVPHGGLIADLGAATGITAHRILQRHPGRDIRFALYDEQQAMLDQADKLLAPLAPGRVECHAAGYRTRRSSTPTQT